MKYEFIIVGQGLAGTFLSYFLEQQKRDFLVVDQPYDNSPSKLAAGVINPVTGRRLVTVWLADEIIPFAEKAYTELGNELGVNGFAQKNIVDFFPNPFMRESFTRRIEEGNQYVRMLPDESYYSPYFNYEFGCGEILPVYVANLNPLLDKWRKHLLQTGRLLETHFDLNDLSYENGKVKYKDIEAEKIIFCDGAGAGEHPWFKHLPFAPNKGEALIAEIPGLPSNHLFKKSMALVPQEGLGKDIFWIGSNYIWDFSNADPTPEFRAATEKTMNEWLKIPFKILEHRCGIRPATLERRPFVGMHPAFPFAGILNGLGTKGVSLAPYFAKQMADHLTENKDIQPEADVRRFTKVLSRDA